MTQTTAPLTQEQRDVVEAPVHARILVIAGAGTGKTHVLIARLEELVTSHGLSPGQEVLVLSFSRGAVREIRNRLAAAGGSAAYVRAYTFDSFATRLLSMFALKGSWLNESYDGRIIAATELIRANHDCQAYVSQHRHVMVDEMQDLVGVRGELVKVVLQTVPAFTLFGDPAQAIFNYQLTGLARQLGAAPLFAWVRSHFNDSLLVKSFANNFRANTTLALKAFTVVGPQLALPNPDYTRIRQDLEALLLQVPSLGDLNGAVPMLKRAKGTTAILCRTNGQALLISKALRAGGVEHRLQRAAVDRAVAPWVGIALGSVNQILLGRSLFISRYQSSDFAHWGAPPADAAWSLLKRIDGRRAGDLDLSIVRERLAMGDVPDELTYIAPAKVVVSTIHRAKGLEFDAAIVVEPKDEQGDATVLAEEARTLYVALTRPRNDLFQLERPNMWRIRVAPDLDDRWIRQGRQDWQVHGFEVRGMDAHRLDPAGAFIMTGDALSVQEYVRRHVRPGDALVLVRMAVERQGQPRAFYRILHDDRVEVGVTTEAFGGLLLAALRRFWRRAQFPAAITDVFVDCVDTVAGPSQIGTAAGLGSSSIWLRVRPYGLGRLVY